MMNFRIRAALFAVFIASLWSCTPTRYVRPLAEGEKAIQGSFGGPLLKNFGPPIPVPFITAGAGYGLKPNTTVFGNFHVTSALFGTMQLDLGATQGILKPNGWAPGLSASAVANAAFDIHEGHFKLWPQLDANAYWEYGEKRHFGYVGINTWWEPRALAHASEPGIQLVVPGMQVGNTFAGKSWDKSLELSWRNFPKPSTDAVVDWAALGGLGAVGFHFTITKRF